MPKREFQEKSVKKAVAKACRELSLNTTDLDYKIVSHGSSGIFGLVGSRKAKILVTLPAAEDESPDEPTGESVAQEVSVPKPVTEPPPPVDSKTLDPEAVPAATPDPDDEPPLTKNTEPSDINEVVEFGQSFLQRLVDMITLDTTITSTAKNRRIVYDVAGGNAALLIGKHGQTLEALQFLTERAMNRKRDQRLLVEVDVAAYQAKRKETLIDQAKRMADKADQNGRPVTIGPMSPQDRRVIHMTLKSYLRVRTQSNGQGVIRKLTIYPKKKGKRPPKKR